MSTEAAGSISLSYTRNLPRLLSGTNNAESLQLIIDIRHCARAFTNVIVVTEQTIFTSYRGLVAPAAGGFVYRRKIGFKLVDAHPVESSGIVRVGIHLLAGEAAGIRHQVCMSLV